MIMKTYNLNRILSKLESIWNEQKSDDYHIPSIWLNPYAEEIRDINVDAVDFFINRIQYLLSINDEKINHTEQVFVYNMFIRYTTAYDHDGDDRLISQPMKNGFRETGTFLKAIAILPYIKSLGCNAIYLLPVTSIGKAGKKGNLGSPYAIADPYKIDENLSEPILNVDIEVQFAAFTEAAHLMEMRVITEFVFRTTSIDSPLAIEHPEWFYWIKEDIKSRKGYSNDKNKYGPPYFSGNELTKIFELVDNKDFKALPEPSKDYRDLFVETPVRVIEEDGQIIGHNNKKLKAKIAYAFADWPPDDNQPVWSDVTYLKLYSHPRYNYIAYNTIRMYSEELAVEKNKQNNLWEHISGIIPYFQDKFDIDGVMIDMGHALPEELLSTIIERARKKNPDFILWEENFTLTTESKDKGFNASLGYLPFDSHVPQKLKAIINDLASNNCPIDFFLTAETHNTKRSSVRPGGVEFSIYIWTVLSLLPGVRFIHSGFELGEIRPVNTGLHFADHEIESYSFDSLPLFSVSELSWNKNSNIINHIRKVNKIVGSFAKLMEIIPVNSLNPDVLSYIFRYENDLEIIMIAAYYSTNEINTILFFDKNYNEINDELDKGTYSIKDKELLISLNSLQVVLGEIT